MKNQHTQKLDETMTFSSRVCLDIASSKQAPDNQHLYALSADLSFLVGRWAS